MRFPANLQLGSWASGEGSLSAKGGDADERDVLKRRVHELHVQNEKLLDLVAEERLAKQGLEKELQLTREHAQQMGAPSAPATSGGPLSGVFSFATVLSPPTGAQANAASEEAKLENDMLKTKLATLREAYEALQREKEGEKRGAAEDVQVLQEQVRSLKRALMQMQDGKDISEAADELIKVPDHPPPPLVPQPQPQESAMEVDMLREQLETLRKAYRELQEEIKDQANSDSEDDGEMGLRGVQEFGRASSFKLASELEKVRIVEAALRQSVAEADARVSKLEAQAAEEESGRRTAEAEVMRLQAELEESSRRCSELEAKNTETSTQLEKLESLGADEAAKASVIELNAELEQLRKSLSQVEEQKREVEVKATDERTQHGEALRKAQQEVETLKHSLKEEETCCESLREQLETLQSETEQQHRLLEARQAEHSSQLEELQSQVKALKAELSAEQEKSRVAEMAHSESRAAISAAADMRIAELVAELEKVKVSSFAEVQAREQELKHLSEQLQREVQSLRADLERTEDSKRGLQRKLREAGENKSVNGGLVQTGSFLSVAAMEPMGPEGIMYVLKIEELEAENARLSEQVHGASALYIPKIQELESDIRDTTQTLEEAWESQQALQEDVAAKAKMIRDLLRRAGYTEKSGSTLTRFLRVIPWASSSSSSKSAAQSAGEDPGLSVEELERALEKALLEIAQLHDSQDGQSPVVKRNNAAAHAQNSAGVS